jgi:hypothetical protein
MCWQHGVSNPRILSTVFDRWRIGIMVIRLSKLRRPLAETTREVDRRVPVLSSLRFDRRDARGKRHRCGAVLSRVFARKTHLVLSVLDRCERTDLASANRADPPIAHVDQPGAEQIRRHVNRIRPITSMRR